MGYLFYFMGYNLVLFFSFITQIIPVLAIGNSLSLTPLSKAILNILSLGFFKYVEEKTLNNHIS